ncbi:uncharacterized protein LOC116301920 [Actinia tenebrosa]|uniref:Uncharacterized protein LOC116301920 n=1 Tax=Actinia tenebrosa TaxID=6105 RepID=A0A6P8IJJ4_ACTTE|nr:uncharacterized protein LOC116301920 [Actinia tenebrosa]
MKIRTLISFPPKCFVLYSLFFVVVQLSIHDVLIQALNPGVRRELWQTIPGDSVANLTSSNEYQSKAANIIDILPSLDAPIDIGEVYGQKLTTYFLAPETGNYFFVMSCDQSCQLWVSRDVMSRNVEMILEVKPPGSKTNRDWTRSNTPIYMVDNDFYFLQVFMKEQNGSDFLSIGVDLPKGSSIKPIREPYLFLERPEQLTGSFVLVENAAIPSNGLVRSYPSVSQTLCAHYCLRYVTGCKAYCYHVITSECLLYSVTISEAQSIESDSNTLLYNKI